MKTNTLVSQICKMRTVNVELKDRLQHCFLEFVFIILKLPLLAILALIELEI